MTEPTTEVMARTGRGTEAETEGGATVALEWGAAMEMTSKGGFFWLTTLRPDGAPHVRPLFAVWVDSRLYLSSNRQARKARNLVGDGRCTITAGVEELHLVVEGDARRVEDEATLQRVVEAYDDTYGWPTTIVGDQLDAPFAAPTSGGPPFDVWEITPTMAYGFPATGETFAPTRWRFTG